MIKYFSIPYQDIYTYSNEQVVNNKQMTKLNITNAYDIYNYIHLEQGNLCNIKQIYDNTGHQYNFSILSYTTKYELFLMLNSNITSLTFVLEFDEIGDPVNIYPYYNFDDLFETYNGTQTNLIGQQFDTEHYDYYYFDSSLNGTIVDQEQGFCIFEKTTSLSQSYFDGIYLEHQINQIDDIYNLYFYVQGNIIDHTGTILSNKKQQINIRKIGTRYYTRQQFVDSLQDLEFEQWQYDTDSTQFTLEFILHSTSIELKINHVQLSVYNTFNVGEYFAIDNMFIRQEQDSGQGRFTKFNYISMKVYDIYYSQLDYSIGRFLTLQALEINNIDISEQENFISGFIQTRLPIQDIKLLYNYDFTDIVNEDYILDLQYKNYIIYYSIGVTIFDRFDIDLEQMDIQKEYFYRQLTPFYIQDEALDNKNKLFSLFQESMLQFINKQEQLMYRYGDLFNPYDSDVYMKKTFYMYLLDIDIFEEFSFKIEQNTQIYQLLSLKFFKTLQKNYVNRGIVSNIDELLDNSFKNLSSVLQLYQILFNETYGVHINSYQQIANQKDFYSYCKDGGIQTIFEKQKQELYRKYKNFIENTDKEISQYYLLHNKIKTQDIIDNIKTDIMDDLLQKSVYRSLVIVYDSQQMRTVNIKNQLIQFMDFIYRQYLPINMEVIFIDLYQLPSNLTSDRAKQYDFVHFTFNTLKTPAEVIRSIFNQ